MRLIYSVEANTNLLFVTSQSGSHSSIWMLINLQAMMRFSLVASIFPFLLVKTVPECDFHCPVHSNMAHRRLHMRMVMLSTRGHLSTSELWTMNGAIKFEYSQIGEATGSAEVCHYYHMVLYWLPMTPPLWSPAPSNSSNLHLRPFILSHVEMIVILGIALHSHRNNQ